MSSVISSRKNAHFKRWLSLLDSHGIKRHRQCLVSGHHLRKEVERHPRIPIQELLLPPSSKFRESSPSSIRSYELPHSLFQELDVFGIKEPLLVCGIPEIPVMDLTQAPQGLEVVCPMGDPGNLGALLRCCRIFDVRTVILLQEAVHPFHPKVMRASSGAVFAQSLTWGSSIADLNTANILRWMTALDLHGKNLSRMKWPEHLRLLIGEEGMGIPPFGFAERVCIPQKDLSFPLNAAVAGGIVLYAYRNHSSPL